MTQAQEDTMQDVWHNTREPTLDEIFAEPIVQMLMQRDGVHAREMQYQLHRVANRHAINRGIR